MEASVPKRRKTSPTESIPVESTTPPGPPPTQREEQSDPQPEPQLSPSRDIQRSPFASPTQSSLARQNPKALNPTRDAASRTLHDLPASRPTSRDENREVGTAPALITERRSDEDASRSSPSGSAAHLRYAASESRSAPAARRSPAARAGGSTHDTQLPHRTPTRPQPRPLPPPDPTDQEEEIVGPLMGRSLRPLPNTGVIPVVAREEPRLPPTPQHPDPVVSTPPSGIHNTPSKRRRDETQREQRTSSPLKPSEQEQRPQKPQKQVHRTGAVASPRRKSPARPVEAIKISTSKPALSEEKSKKERPSRTHPRRSVRLQGPDWEKTQKRDALLQEIALLETDLELARSEHFNAAKGLPSSSDPGILMDLLRRRLLPAEKGPELDPNSRWIEAAMDPFAMLGFNGRSHTQFPPILVQSSSEEKNESPLISHHPVALTAAEELPYLQIFTPLKFSTHMTTVPSKPDHPNQNTHQKYTINVRSASPPGLFVARVEMVVSTRNQAVASLAVPQLDPAAFELRTFIDSITEVNTTYNPALTRNVSILCYAMGEWYRVALKRAKFWHVLDKEFGPESKDGFANIVAAMRTRKKRKRKARKADEADGGGADGLEGIDSLGSLDELMLSKKEILPHMGRTSMDLEVPWLSEDRSTESSQLRVSWGIEFDWTGVAKSKLATEISVPGKCESPLLPFPLF